MIKKIEISHKTIIFTVFFLVFLWVLFQIRDVILIFFVSLLIMTILNPIVTKLSRFKIPRPLSIALLYLVIFILLGFSIAILVPPLVEQTTNFTEGLPLYLENIGKYTFIGQQISGQILSLVGTLPGYAIKFGISVFSNVLNLVMVMFIGLTILGIPFALPLAILAVFLEIVPTIGPIISAIPAVIIGLSISPLTAIAAIALIFLIHQTENYVLVPKIMEKSVGVSPIVTLLCLAIGLKIAGIIGVLISVPVFISLQVIVKEYLSS